MIYDGIEGGTLDRGTANRRGCTHFPNRTDTGYKKPSIATGKGAEASVSI